jgi:YidC/Oxa1 family membrane protein insertase
MDKRVLMTMVAMVAFFVAVNALYPVLFPPPPRAAVPTPVAPGSPGAIDSVPAEGGAPASPASLDGETPGEAALITSPAEAAAPQIPFKDVTVETPEYTAVFSERGGRLISLTLKEYLSAKIRDDDPDVPQQLISQVAGQPDQSLALRLFAEESDYVDLAGLRLTADQESLTVGPGGSAALTMTGRTSRGLVVEKKLTFSAGSYLIGQKVRLRNESDGAYGGRLGLTLAAGPFTIGRRGRYDTVAGSLGTSNFSATPEKAAAKLPREGELTRASWLGYMSQYFLAAVVLSGEDGALQDPARLRLWGADKLNGQVQLTASWPLQLEPGGQALYDFDVYYGPKQTADLAAAGHELGRSIDLGWFWFLAKPMAWLLRTFFSIVGNYGVAIIIVTILIKIALWPLTAKSYKSMRQMQKIQPLLTALRQRHKDDRETMNKEMMQLYKTYKINPMGGCLPMLLQIPFFIAFYRVLDYALELRGAPFMLWISDLSAPDRLGDLGFKVPFLEQPTGLPVLTIIMTVSMIWQQKMTPTMGDPMQAKMMMLMPIVFAVILINMPAGLVLYWLVNNILSIFQQKLVNRPAPSKAASAK